MPMIHVLVNTSNPDLLNGTVLEIGPRTRYKDSEENELLYVVVVIMFYATALMVLIATQIRKQRREGQDIEYYDEHLERIRNKKAKMPLLSPSTTKTEGQSRPIGGALEKIVDEGFLESRKENAV